MHKLEKLVVNLKQQLRDQEVENARLRDDRKETQSALARERIEHTKDKAKGFFDHLRYRLNT